MNLSLIRGVRQAVGVIGVALVVALVSFSLFTRIAPLTGRELFIIGGGSMEPTIPTGSLIIATRTDIAAIAVGDVVTITAENGVIITHRINRIVESAEGRRFELKGDANAHADPNLVSGGSIVGVADRYVPFLGYVQAFLSTIAGLSAALVLLASVFGCHFMLGRLTRLHGAGPGHTQDPVTS